MALVATPGAANANSFLTVDEADAHFGTRLHVSDWTSASVADKEAALIWATRLMNATIPWRGSVVSETQALAWPRSGLLTRNGFPLANDIIPRELKEATAELALLLLRSERTAGNEAQEQGITRLKAGTVDIEFKEEFQFNVVPATVTDLLVPSWFGETVASVSVFKSL